MQGPLKSKKFGFRVQGLVFRLLHRSPAMGCKKQVKFGVQSSENQGEDNRGFYKPSSKLLVSPLITPRVVPYIISYITSPLGSLDYSLYPKGPSTGLMTPM